MPGTARRAHGGVRNCARPRPLAHTTYPQLLWATLWIRSCARPVSRTGIGAQADAQKLTTRAAFAFLYGALRAVGTGSSGPWEAPCRAALRISVQDGATVSNAAAQINSPLQPQGQTRINPGNAVIYSPLKLQIFRSYSHPINRPQ